MPQPFPAPEAKAELFNQNISGFPLFFDKAKPRIIASDPFSFFEHLIAISQIGKPDKTRALAFVQQAFDFYSAAELHQSSTKPLLLYYSFLNLTKVLLLLKSAQIPPAAKHGISNPKKNNKQKFRLEGQSIKIEKKAKDCSQLFPEIFNAVGGHIPKNSEIKVLDVIMQIPSIHRTYSKITEKADIFYPIKRINVLRFQNKLWMRSVIKKTVGNDANVLRGVKRLKRFKSIFRQVASSEQNEIWFESKKYEYNGPSLNKALLKLSFDAKQACINPILTKNGYIYYFSRASEKLYMPHLLAAYASIFYFGSITRYHPHVFDKLREGKYGWLCEELLETQPTQLLYLMASEGAGVDVVKPFAITS
ncbi:MAG: hypothetical protein H8E27_14040 [Verrucomicrobia subdivision 3 bacterium]|nr:hypothetical protein [Limisphaerales bacterium]